MDSSKNNFIRSLNLFDAIAVVAGSMIGSGIFIVSADITRQLNSALLLLIVWGLAGFMTAIGALSYGEFAASLPEAGGQYVYIRKAWGELMGFLYGWSLFLVIHTGSIAAVSIAFAKFLGILIPSIGISGLSLYGIHLSTIKIIAISLILAITYLNSRGIKIGAFVQNIFTISNISALLGIIIVGLFFGIKSDVISTNFIHTPLIPKFDINIYSILAIALVGTFFAFDGWNNLTFIGGEIKKPEKYLPLALFIGTGIVVLLYFFTNIIYLTCLPLTKIQTAANDIVGAAFMNEIFGTYGKDIIAIIITIAALGCVNSMILAGPRVFYAMAKDGLFFKKMSELGKKTNVPENAMYLMCFWTCVLVLSGSYSQLLDYVIFAALLFYAMTIGGLFPFRKKCPNIERPYKAAGYPFLQIIYCAIAVFIALNLLIYKPVCSWFGLIIVLSGVPVFYLWKRSSNIQSIEVETIEEAQ